MFYVVHGKDKNNDWAYLNASNTILKIDYGYI